MINSLFEKFNIPYKENAPEEVAETGEVNIVVETVRDEIINWVESKQDDETSDVTELAVILVSKYGLNLREKDPIIVTVPASSTFRSSMLPIVLTGSFCLSAIVLVIWPILEKL